MKKNGKETLGSGLHMSAGLKWIYHWITHVLPTLMIRMMISVTVFLPLRIWLIVFALLVVERLAWFFLGLWIIVSGSTI